MNRISAQSQWEEMFAKRYASYRAEELYIGAKMHTDSVPGQGKDYRLEVNSNKTETVTKAKTYAYYLFSNDYARMADEYKILMLLMLLDYDNQHPEEPVYRNEKGKSGITYMAGQLLIDALPKDEPEFMDPNQDYEAQMKKYLDTAVVKLIPKYNNSEVSIEQIKIWIREFIK